MTVDDAALRVQLPRARSDIRALLDQLIAVVAHCAVKGQRRYVKEIYWRKAVS